MYKRITLLLTISNGVFTKSRSFNPEHLYTVPHINYSGFDEVILVCTDVEPSNQYQFFINKLVDSLTVPLVISGGVSSLCEAKSYFDLGADRLIINRALWDKPSIIEEIAKIYGKQAVILSLDFHKKEKNITTFDWGKKKCRESLLPDYFAEILPYIGEILIQDVEQDGRVLGANIDLIYKVCNLMPKGIPIHIGSCGLVDWDQYAELLNLEFVDAVSVSNIHHMSKKAISSLRHHCIIKDINIRNI